MKNYLNIIVLFLMVQLNWAQQKTIKPDLKKKVEIASSTLSTSPTNPMDPVAVNATLVWSNDKSQVAVILKANIADEWHIYAYVPETQPYITSELELDLPEGFKQIGDWEKPLSEPYGDDIYVYHGASVFVQYCAVENYTKGSEIKCGLYYQTCDLRKCFPPQTKSKTIKL